MSQKRVILFAKFFVVVAALPLLIYGHQSGPDPFVTGDPKDPGGATCNQSSCHVGTAVNGGGGKVQINLPGGGTYVPGVAQQISVTISDPVQRAWGFELTARLLADNSQSGDLRSSDSSTFVQCADGTMKQTACAAGQNTQFVQHTRPKVGAGSGTFTFQWTPPATNAGTVVLYVAGNAANNDGNYTGDHIYTSSIQLAPAAAVPAPSISGVVNAATLQATMAASTYVTIFGTGLSTTSVGRAWAAADFTSNTDGTLRMPAALDGTSVTVAGVPAYVEYVSPTQLNIITPGSAGSGNGVPVVVTLNGQPSAPFPVTLENLAPSFFAWTPYLVAQHVNFKNVGKVGLFAGQAPDFTTPAKPGETIQLYGTGLGPTTPAIAAGIQTDKTYSLNPMPTATVGTTAAVVSFAGLTVGLSQVYQVNVTIPDSTPDGDWPLVVTVNGVPSYSGLITVQR
jgi:uncharacterized protein (TIGR03437 family)